MKINQNLWKLLSFENYWIMKRILLKLSWEMLQWWTEKLYDIAAIESLAISILGLQKRGFEIVIVMWWGNIWRSRDTKELQLDRVVSDYIWMTGTILNAVVVALNISSVHLKYRIWSLPCETCNANKRRLKKGLHR